MQCRCAVVYLSSSFSVVACLWPASLVQCVPLGWFSLLSGCCCVCLTAGKVVTKVEKTDSFFQFFNDPQEAGEEEDEEMMYGLIDSQFEMGLTFKDKVCGRAPTLPCCRRPMPLSHQGLCLCVHVA